MRSLLFVDMLGARSRWHESGRPGVESAVSDFHRLVTQCAQQSSCAAALSGGLESDAAALICPDSLSAVELGISVYSQAFARPIERDSDRMWLRGVIAPMPDGEQTRESHTVGGLPNVAKYSYGSAFLDAIAIEKSGVKGMRLLIADSLATEELRQALKRERGTLHMMPLRKMTHSGYPTRVRSVYQDVLWMDAGVGASLADQQRQMEKRLRWSASCPEEFAQAAATQVLFHEYAAIDFVVSQRGAASC